MRVAHIEELDGHHAVVARCEERSHGLRGAELAGEVSREFVALDLDGHTLGVVLTDLTLHIAPAELDIGLVIVHQVGIEGHCENTLLYTLRPVAQEGVRAILLGGQHGDDTAEECEGHIAVGIGSGHGLPIRAAETLQSHSEHVARVESSLRDVVVEVAVHVDGDDLLIDHSAGVDRLSLAGESVLKRDDGVGACEADILVESDCHLGVVVEVYALIGSGLLIHHLQRLVGNAVEVEYECIGVEGELRVEIYLLTLGDIDILLHADVVERLGDDFGSVFRVGIGGEVLGTAHVQTACGRGGVDARRCLVGRDEVLDTQFEGAVLIAYLNGLGHSRGC